MGPLTRRLRDPRLHWTLLAAVGLPSLGAFLLAFLAGPLGDSSPPQNDLDVYIAAARAISAGRDPYAGFAATIVHVDPTLTGTYIYPPGLAWWLQPLAAMGRPEAHAVAAIVLLVAVAVGVGLVIAATGAGWGRFSALLTLLALGYFPVWQNLAYQQVNLVLLALAGAWLWSWRRPTGGVAGGVAVGVAAATKLVQAPYVLLAVLRRRWWMLGGAAAGGLLIAGAGARWLWEYVGTVLPHVGGGTGWVLNQAPVALVPRLVNPVSFYRTTPETGREIALAAVAVGLVVLAASYRVLRRPPGDEDGMILDVAVVVAACPVFLPLTWDTHLVLLLLPLIVLAADAASRRDRPGLVLAGAAWLLTGPLHLAYLLAFSAVVQGRALREATGAGLPAAADLGLRLGAEMGAVGIVVLWLACLRAAAASRQHVERQAPGQQHPRGVIAATRADRTGLR